MSEDRLSEVYKAYLGGLRAEPDMVNSPGHYTQHRKGIECIDVIEDFNSPNLANVVKYAWRVDSGGKWDDIEDLDKLIWYAKREKARRTGVQQVRAEEA